jgi:peptidoglycan/LPS O-acetylase OafA/YrhL
VVFDHFTVHVLQAVRIAVYNVFDPGLYGVFVFFMVSGYIVPASLERKGSIRTFWVSRVFRLFPLFIFAVVGVIVLHDFSYAGLSHANTHTTAAIFAHLFMLSDILGIPSVINVLWTLSYEMVFYLLLTALFTVGLHKRSGRIALGFAAAAVLLGTALPTVWLSHSSLGVTTVAIGADVLILVGLAFAVAGRRLPRALGAWLAAGTGLVLVAVNERVYAYEGLTILALMFTGTMLYRAERGQIAQRKAFVFAVAVFTAAMAAGAWHIATTPPVDDPRLRQRQWVLSVALAGLTFAIAMALRELPIPKFLAWLGLVSYSVYLLHPLLIDIYTKLPWTHGTHTLGVQVLLASGFMAALLACSAMTYYLVEAPTQRLGKRVAGWLDARYGPDRLVTAGPKASLSRRDTRVNG